MVVEWPNGDRVTWRAGRVVDVVSFNRGIVTAAAAAQVGPEIKAGSVYEGRSQRGWVGKIRRKVMSIKGDVVRYRATSGHDAVMSLPKFAAWAQREVIQNEH